MKQYIVAGGDKRIFYLAEYLKKQGNAVDAICVPGWEETQTIDEIFQMQAGAVLVLPVPVTRDGIMITGCENANILVADIAARLDASSLVCGGLLPDTIKDACREKDIPFYDYMKDDSVAIKNAVATAEGAIAEAFLMSEINIENSRCLVTGYGRCGSVLARKLVKAGADVTITARSVEACMKAEMDSCHTILLSKLAKSPELAAFDFCFNTIPSMVLDADILCHVKPDIVMIDIASMPGGMDFAYLDKRQIRYKHSLGIPGKYSPKTSGEILANAILDK